MGARLAEEGSRAMPWGIWQCLCPTQIIQSNWGKLSVHYIVEKGSGSCLSLMGLLLGDHTPSIAFYGSCWLM